MNCTKKMLFLICLLCISFWALPAHPAQAFGSIRDQTVSGNTPDPSEEKDAKRELTRIRNYNVLVGGIILPIGDEALLERAVKNVESRFHFVTVYNDQGDLGSLYTESIDSSQVDPYHPGSYSITVTLQLDEDSQEDFFVSDSVRILQVPVKICDPDLFELWVNLTDEDSFHVTWLKKQENAITVQYLYSEQPLDQEHTLNWEWEDCPEDTAFGGYLKMMILRSSLIPNTNYYFRIVSETEISSILHIVDNGDYYVCETINGHRDGSNTDGVELPDITQPAPVIPGGDKEDAEVPSQSLPEDGSADVPPRFPPEETMSDTSSQPSCTASEKDSQPITSPPSRTSDSPLPPHKETSRQVESVTAAEDILSGDRIMLLLAENGCVRFSKQGIVLTLPAQSLEGLGISSGDSLRVSIEKQSRDYFCFSLWLNDISVTQLDNMRIMLPCEAPDDGKQLTLVDSNEETVASGSYNSVQQTVSFDLQQSGAYRLEQASVPPTEEHALHAQNTPEVRDNNSTSPAAATGLASRLLSAFWLVLLPVIALILLFTAWHRRRKPS